MTQRDFLTADPAVAVGSSNEKLAQLLSEQADYLAEIALGIRKLTPSVLCSAVVKGTSQLTNAITDLRPHEVTFQVGGKPVSIYSLLTFSTYKTASVPIPVLCSVLSMANINDGFTIPTSALLLPMLTVRSVWVQLSALDAVVNSCPINGPAHTTYGGLFLYGFTIPDYDRIRGSNRS